MITIDKILEVQRAWQIISTEDDAAISTVASQALTGCAEAIAVLKENLQKLGYVWAVSESIPVGILERNIQVIEKTTGLPIPKILVMFWEVIGGISFVDLERYCHVDFWNEHKIIAPLFFCDGLYIEACTDEWASFICGDFDDWKEFNSQGELDDFLFTLSPDGYHKDNISGGAPYGVYAKSQWKPTWENFEWSGADFPATALSPAPDFLSYLRTTILECAGFPAFLGVPAFSPIKEYLLQGVPLF